MKLGIVIPLGELEDLMKMFIDEQQSDIGQQLTLSVFLRWLSNKVNAANKGKVEIDG